MVAVSLTRLLKCRLGLAGLLFLTLLIVSSSSFAAPASSLLNWYKHGFTGQVASTKYNGTQYFAVSRGFGMIELYNTNNPTAPVKRFVGNTNDAVTTMAFSPSGQYLAVGGTGDLAKGNFIHIWDLSDGQDNAGQPPLVPPAYVITQSTKGLRSLLFHSDSTLIGLTDTKEDKPTVTDTAVKIWNVENGTLINTFTLDGVTFTCMTLGQGHILVGDTQGSVHEWRLDDGLYQGTLPAPPGYNYSLGDRVVKYSAQEDKTYWTSTYHTVWSGSKAVTALAFSSNGYLAIGQAPSGTTVTQTLRHYGSDNKIIDADTEVLAPVTHEEGRICIFSRAYSSWSHIIAFGPTDAGSSAEGASPTALAFNTDEHSGESPNLIAAGLMSYESDHPYAMVTTWEARRIDPGHDNALVNIDGDGPESSMLIGATNHFALAKTDANVDINGYGIPSITLAPDGRTLVTCGTSNDNIVTILGYTSRKSPLSQPFTPNYYYDLSYWQSLPSNVNPNVDYVPPQIGSFAVAGSSLFYGGTYRSLALPDNDPTMPLNKRIYWVNQTDGTRNGTLNGAYNPDNTYNYGSYNPDVLAVSSVKFPTMQNGHVVSSELLATVYHNILYLWRTSDGTLVSTTTVATGNITALAFARTLTSEAGGQAGIRLAVATSDNKITILKIVGTTTPAVASSFAIPASVPANALAFSPVMSYGATPTLINYLAYGTSAGVTVCALDVKTGLLLGATTPDNVMTYPVDTKMPVKFFLRSGKLMLMTGIKGIGVAGGTLKLCMVTDDTVHPGTAPAMTLQSDDGKILAPVSGFNALTIFDISPDGNKLITGEGADAALDDLNISWFSSGISLYSMDEFISAATGELSGTTLAENPGYAYKYPQEPLYHPGSINALTFASDGLSFFSGTDKFELANWQTPTITAPSVTGAVQGTTNFKDDTVGQTTQVILNPDNIKRVVPAYYTVRVKNTGVMASRYVINMSGDLANTAVNIKTTDLANNVLDLTTTVENVGHTAFDGKWVTLVPIESGAWQDFTIEVIPNAPLAPGESVTFKFTAKPEFSEAGESLEDNILLTTKTADAPIVQGKIAGTATFSDGPIQQNVSKKGLTAEIGTARYTVEVKNTSDAAQKLDISAPVDAGDTAPDAKITIIPAGGADIAAVLRVGGTWTTPEIAAGGTLDFAVSVTLPNGSVTGKTAVLTIVAASRVDAAINDKVKLVTKLSGASPYLQGKVQDGTSFTEGQVDGSVSLNNATVPPTVGTAHYIVRVNNMGDTPNKYRISIPVLPIIAANATMIKVTDVALSQDITATLSNGGLWNGYYDTPTKVSPSGYRDFAVDVTLSASLGGNDNVTLPFTAAWVNDAGIADNSQADQIQLVTQFVPLSALDFTVSPASPRTEGDTITITPIPTGGAHLEYRLKVDNVVKPDFDFNAHMTSFQWHPELPVANTAHDFSLVVEAREVTPDNSASIIASGVKTYHIDPSLSSKVTLTADQASPRAMQGTMQGTIRLTASTIGGTSVKYQFKANSTILQDSDKWYCDWTPAAPGTYTLSVVAYDVNGSNPAVKYTSEPLTYVITPMLSKVTLTTSSTSSTPAGYPVTLTATPTGGANLVYKFYVGQTLIRDFDSDKTALWVPSRIGTYKLTVIAKDLNAANKGTVSVTSAVVRYSVTKGVPNMTFADISPASACSVNTPVTIKVTPLTGSNFKYRFMAGSTIVQDYSSATTATWTPTQVGVYKLIVTAQDLNNPSKVYVTDMKLYTVTSRLSAVKITRVNPTSPAPAGTTISLQASATGGANVVYQFMVDDICIRDFAQNPGATWKPTTDGAHILTVVAKDLNSAEPSSTVTSDPRQFTVGKALDAAAASSVTNNVTPKASATAKFSIAPVSTNQVKKSVVLTTLTTEWAKIVSSFMTGTTPSTFVWPTTKANLRVMLLKN